jgi:dTMP kinase
VGRRIRNLLLDHQVAGGPADVVLAPRAEALLYAADRAHHVATVVRPALAKGAVVVSDRYIDSSLAYQGAGRTLPVEQVSWLSAWATGGLRPDLVVLLDIDPAVGLGRARGRGNLDRLEGESLGFHERVRYAFLDLAGADARRYFVVDAKAPAMQIAAAVLARVHELLPSSAPDEIDTDADEVPQPPEFAEVAPEVPLDAPPTDGRVSAPVLSNVDRQP